MVNYFINLQSIGVSYFLDDFWVVSTQSFNSLCLPELDNLNILEVRARQFCKRKLGTELKNFFINEDDKIYFFKFLLIFWKVTIVSR